MWREGENGWAGWVMGVWRGRGGVRVKMRAESEGRVGKWSMTVSALSLASTRATLFELNVCPSILLN